MATKYTTAILALLLTAAPAFADHTIEHNAEAIESNSQRIDNNDEDIQRLDAGVALSNALGSHQYDFDHSGAQASFGLGSFRGESGASVGFAIKPSENTLLNLQGGRTSEGDQGASMSFNVKF